MGQLFSRRQQKNTVEILEELEQEIDDSENRKSDTELRRNRFVGYLFLSSILICVFLFIYWYFYLFSKYPSKIWMEYLIYFSPLLCLYPLTVWLLKLALCWWYDQSLKSVEQHLLRLQKRKREILDTVKDKETYKVAKEILERFDPQARQEKALKKARELQQQQQQQQQLLMRRYASMDMAANQIRQRNQQQQIFTPIIGDRDYRSLLAIGPTPRPPPPPPPRMAVLPPTPAGGGGAPQPTSTPFNNKNTAPGPGPFMTPSFPSASIGDFRPYGTGGAGARLPRPVLPKDRSRMDKFIDYLLGDGPSNRYALICQQCRSHNGMALKEELETMSFRCCYCYAFNPARRLSHPPQPLLDSGSASKPTAPNPDNDNDTNSTTCRNDSSSLSIDALGMTPVGGNHPQGRDLDATTDNDHSRAPSRASITSLDSTQSAPPNLHHRRESNNQKNQNHQNQVDYDQQQQLSPIGASSPSLSAISGDNDAQVQGKGENSLRRASNSSSAESLINQIDRERKDTNNTTDDDFTIFDRSADHDQSDQATTVFENLVLEKSADGDEKEDVDEF